MNLKRAVPFLLLAAIGAYELHALSNSEEGDTWSELTWAASSRPLLPFAAGLLAGHLFWQRVIKTEKAKGD